MRFLVFQHIASEHPGILRRFMREDDVEWQAVELDEGEGIPDLDPFDALIVMGGPMDVWETEAHPWLLPEKAAIREWVIERERPYLGICLGHQLLADALGGACAPMPVPEIGILETALTAAGREDRLFAGVAPASRCLQWHSVEVTAPPPDAVVLAASDICGSQAMRVGRHAWGTQYHVELEPDTIPNWAHIPAYREALETALGDGALERMKAEAAPLMDDFGRNAGLIYRNFRDAVTAAKAA